MGRVYLHKELTHKIIGFSFEIFNKLGYGLPEKTYQKALEAKLVEDGIRFQREKYGKIRLDNVMVGRYFADFIIEEKLVVELKVRNEIYQGHIVQLVNYLKSENYSTGLLIVFSKDGVKIKRIAN
ncbi:hypothetical protein A2215_01270 [Candidatus Berkelbacteria bacterium RIFOXYA2_FULL_43_10]|uniref:GxxExxY protein n=1 Tax=Candidatus Berkelbacteria bacterium RIFOXYA2_FULL_43_10 TaxID=1797472 RepID=A0A1F5E9B0_9BACT|nr:MAG: hypothetical protein A2215_01270 [Candidatus Berkelbacteria bacterium RIFOXYA2_FULL_43_10]